MLAIPLAMVQFQVLSAITEIVNQTKYCKNNIIWNSTEIVSQSSPTTAADLSVACTLRIY